MNQPEIKTIELKTDIKVFGVTVTEFPQGIPAAFDAIVKSLPGGFDRSFYGLASMEGNRMTYVAAAEEKIEGEAALYGYANFMIRGGTYISKELNEWRTQTSCIKDIFHELMRHHDRVDQSSPAVEWYINEERMVCMLRLND
jgi:predicted transcriptional regulator YdeE